MYSAIQLLGRRFLVDEMPSGVVAFGIAELFYKLHSFSLECLAFLATWYVLSFGHAMLRSAISGDAKR